MKTIKLEKPRCNNCGKEIHGKRYSIFDYDENDTYDLCESCISTVVAQAFMSAIAAPKGPRGERRVAVNYASVEYYELPLVNSEKIVLCFTPHIHDMHGNCYLIDGPEEVYPIVADRIIRQMTVGD